MFVWCFFTYRPIFAFGRSVVRPLMTVAVEKSANGVVNKHQLLLLLL